MRTHTSTQKPAFGRFINSTRFIAKRCSAKILPALAASLFAFLAVAPQARAATVTTAAAGHAESLLYITNDGTLYAFGNNSAGQLGDGTTTTRLTPVQIKTTASVAAIATGEEYSLFATTDGKLYATGLNDYGQLGDGTTKDKLTPVPITTAAPVTAIAAGSYHTLFITTTGKLYAMGYNSNGLLGAGTISGTYKTPQPVPTPGTAPVSAIAAGDDYSLYLTTDGTLWSIGDYSTGNYTSTPAPVTTPAPVIAIASGMDHTLYITDDRTLYALGFNSCGQLGDGTTTDKRNTPVKVQVPPGTKVAAISAGVENSLFVTTDGDLYAMGSNEYGQLGIGTKDTNAHSTPVFVATDVVSASTGDCFAVYITKDGSLWIMGQTSPTAYDLKPRQLVKGDTSPPVPPAGGDDNPSGGGSSGGGGGGGAPSLLWLCAAAALLAGRALRARQVLR